MQETINRSELHKAMDEIGQEYINSMFVPMDTLYVDLEYILDVRLTALLCLASSEEYAVICKQMNKYDLRFTEKPTEVFSGISITEQDIDAFLKKPDRLLYASRMQYTSYFSYLLDMLKMWDVRNHMVQTRDKVAPITIYIGYNDLPLPLMHREFILGNIQKYCPKATVRFTAKSLKDYSKELALQIKHYSIYNLGELLNQPTIQEFISNGLLNGKGLHAFPLIDPTIKSKLPNQARLDGLRDRLALFCNFEYIRAKVSHVE